MLHRNRRLVPAQWATRSWLVCRLCLILNLDSRWYSVSHIHMSRFLREKNNFLYNKLTTNLVYSCSFCKERYRVRSTAFNTNNARTKRNIALFLMRTQRERPFYDSRGNVWRRVRRSLRNIITNCKFSSTV